MDTPPHDKPISNHAVPNRFSSIFPSLNMAVKRREQALQDYGRLQAKVEKYEEKEKTGPVLAKLHQVQGRWESWGRSNRVNKTTIATESSFQGQQNRDTSYSHPHPAPFSDSPDSRILFRRPEKS